MAQKAERSSWLAPRGAARRPRQVPGGRSADTPTTPGSGPRRRASRTFHGRGGRGRRVCPGSCLTLLAGARERCREVVTSRTPGLWPREATPAGGTGRPCGQRGGRRRSQGHPILQAAAAAQGALSAVLALPRPVPVWFPMRTRKDSPVPASVASPEMGAVPWGRRSRGREACGPAAPGPGWPAVRPPCPQPARRAPPGGGRWGRPQHPWGHQMPFRPPRPPGRSGTNGHLVRGRLCLSRDLQLGSSVPHPVPCGFIARRCLWWQVGAGGTQGSPTAAGRRAGCLGPQ